METCFARLETRIEQRTADIMKWSFAFWVASVLGHGRARAVLSLGTVRLKRYSSFNARIGVIVAQIRSR